MATKNGKPGQVIDFQFPQPKEKQTIGQIFYNSKEGTYFGRTPKSWGQLFFFYTIFYIVLAALVAICMQGLFSSLNDAEPKWKLERSLIGTNPGLGFRPLSDETERGSVIQFDTKKPEEGRYWVELLDKFLEQYKAIGKKQKFCSFNETHNNEQVCVVDIDTFGPCSPQNDYGYKNGRPCVFLKLNKIYNWEPQCYDDPKDLPEDMPADLMEHIGNTTNLERQKIWVSCNGQHSMDREILGDIKFYPSQGFPAYYYPYMNQPGYMSPLIAVQFEKVTLNQMVNIECRAWAKNIVYSGNTNSRTGSVAFQLFID